MQAVANDIPQKTIRLLINLANLRGFGGGWGHLEPD